MDRKKYLAFKKAVTIRLRKRLLTQKRTKNKNFFIKLDEELLRSLKNYKDLYRKG